MTAPFIQIVHWFRLLNQLRRQLPGQKAASNAWVSELTLCYRWVEFSFYIYSALVIVPQYNFFSTESQWATFLEIWT